MEKCKQVPIIKCRSLTTAVSTLREQLIQPWKVRNKCTKMKITLSRVLLVCSLSVRTRTRLEITKPQFTYRVVHYLISHTWTPLQF